MSKNLKPSEVAGSIAIAIATISFLGWCSMRDNTGCGDRPARRTETREKSISELRDEDNRKNRALLCKPEVAESLKLMQSEFSGATVMVSPVGWEVLDAKGRQGFAAWAALCNTPDDFITVADRQSGKKLASWSTLEGLEVF